VGAVREEQRNQDVIPNIHADPLCYINTHVLTTNPSL